MSWLPFTSSQQINCATDIKYNNNILNHPELLSLARKIGGISCVNKLIDLGQDKESADAIIDAATEQSAISVLRIIFQPEELSNQELTQDILYPNKDNIEGSCILGDASFVI